MSMDEPFSVLAARSPAPPDRVFSSICRDVAGDSDKKKSRPRIYRVTQSVLALAVGLILTSAGAFLESPGSAGLTVVALSLGAGGLLGAAVVPGEKTLSPPHRKLLLGLISAMTLFAVLLHASSFLSFPAFLEPDPLHHARSCATHSLLSGIIGASLLLFFWRRTDPFSPRLTGALLGLLGGLMGTGSAGIVCHNTEGLHLIFGHAAGLALLGILGSLLGRRCLEP